MSGMNAGGLSPEHRAELAAADNLDVEIRQKRIAELEGDYANSALALEQLAILDPESGYHELTRCYRAAALTSNYVRCDSLEEEFVRRFPLTEELYRHNHEW